MEKANGRFSNAIMNQLFGAVESDGMAVDCVVDTSKPMWTWTLVGTTSASAGSDCCAATTRMPKFGTGQDRSSGLYN